DGSVGQHVQDVPSVAVLDPRPIPSTQRSVVAAGDHGVTDTGAGPVAEVHFASGPVSHDVEAVLLGAVVQLADGVAGRGQQQAGQPGLLVGGPGRVRRLHHLSGVTGVDPVEVEVVVQGGGVAVTDRESGRAFGTVGEPM